MPIVPSAGRRWSERLRRGWVLLSLAVLIAAWVALLPRAFGANAAPALTGDAVQCGTTPTLISPSPLAGREGLGVYNNGPNTIYIGGSAVTTAKGWPVPPGGFWSAAVSYNSLSAGVKVYCVTTVLQVSPADSRYQEVE